jgi:hypothetical protein
MLADGSAVVYQIRSPKTGWDLMILPREPGADPKAFRATEFNETSGQFSPDGKFIAYMSNESGRNEIYVQPYPGPGRTWQISTTGGRDPHWRADGKELFYASADQKLMAVEIQLAPTFQAGIPQPLFLGRVATGPAATKYAPDPTGQKFLVVSTLGREYLTPTNVVLNWPAALGK